MFNFYEYWAKIMNISENNMLFSENISIFVLKLKIKGNYEFK